jgi:hypothetical protein
MILVCLSLDDTLSALNERIWEECEEVTRVEEKSAYLFLDPKSKQHLVEFSTQRRSSVRFRDIDEIQ